MCTCAEVATDEHGNTHAHTYRSGKRLLSATGLQEPMATIPNRAPPGYQNPLVQYLWFLKGTCLYDTCISHVV